LRPSEERAGSPGLWVAGGLRRRHRCWEEEMLRLFEREPAEGRGRSVCSGDWSVWFFPLPRRLGGQQEMGGAASLCFDRGEVSGDGCQRRRKSKGRGPGLFFERVRFLAGGMALFLWFLAGAGKVCCWFVSGKRAASKEKG